MASPGAGYTMLMTDIRASMAIYPISPQSGEAMRDEGYPRKARLIQFAVPFGVPFVICFCFGKFRFL